LSRIAFALAVASIPTAALADLSSALLAIDRRDFEMAIRELAPLAKEGNAEAQYQLGTLYANGDGVPQSYDAAKGLFNAAAAQGNGRARQALSFLSEIGVIVGGNPVAVAAAPSGAGSTMPAAASAGGLPANPGDLRVQLATLPTEEGANAEARRLTRRFQAQLASMTITPERYQMADGAIVFRVLTPAFGEQQARDLCQAIKDDNGSCLLIKP
jgi:TPR repeat protein